MSLKPTISREDAMQWLGVKPTRLWQLMTLGRKHRGRHPTRGGIWPWYRVGQRTVRIEEDALRAHCEHMLRLREDELFAARMRAEAAQLDRLSLAIAG